MKVSYFIPPEFLPEWQDIPGRLSSPGTMSCANAKIGRARSWVSLLRVYVTHNRRIGFLSHFVLSSVSSPLGNHNAFLNS